MVNLSGDLITDKRAAIHHCVILVSACSDWSVPQCTCCLYIEIT